MCVKCGNVFCFLFKAVINSVVVAAAAGVDVGLAEDPFAETTAD